MASLPAFIHPSILDFQIMIMNLLLILIALASVLALLRWRRCSRVLLGLAVLLLLATGCGPLTIWLLAQLQADVAVQAPIAWGQRNAIVLLGAGTVRVAGTGAVEASLFAYGRISKTAMLYRECRQAVRECKVEVSGGDARGLGESEAAIYANDLQRLGVDAADLLLEPRSMNTWQNVQFSGSDYVSGVASWSPLSYNLTMADVALHEYAGIARYRWYNAMGWNVRATRPGAL